MKSVRRRPIEPTSEKFATKRGYSSAKRWRVNVLNSRRVEGSFLWPVAKFGRVSSDADPLGVGGRGTVKDEQHVPTGRGDIDIGRCLNGTVIARARHLGEDDTSSHQVTMGAGGSGEKRDPHICRRTVEEVDVNVVCLPVLPILIYDSVCGLGPSIGQIGREVDFNSEFLRVFLSDAVLEVVLRVGSRDKDATIMKEDRLGVVHTSNDGFSELGDTLASGKGWVIEESIQIWIVGQSETSNALLSTVQDEESAIGEGNHTSHHTAGRLEKELLLGGQEEEGTPKLTMRSMVHVGSGTSGLTVTQLSSALWNSRRSEPPQKMTSKGSV